MGWDHVNSLWEVYEELKKEGSTIKEHVGNNASEEKDVIPVIGEPEKKIRWADVVVNGREPGKKIGWVDVVVNGKKGKKIEETKEGANAHSFV